MKNQNLMKIFALFVITVFLLSGVAAVFPQKAQGKQNSVQILPISPVQIEELKTKIRECKGKETQECKLARQQGIEVAKVKIVEVFEANIARLESLKERIKEDPRLRDEEKKVILEGIDTSIEKLETLKENLPDDATKLREVVQEYKKERENFRLRHRLTLEKVEERRVGLIVERAEHLVKKLERFIEKYNATDLENLKQQFYENIEKANESRNEAIALWNELHERIKNKDITAEEIREMVKAIHQNLEEAKKHLKEAHEILKEILKEIREIREKSTETETESETEVENETE